MLRSQRLTLTADNRLVFQITTDTGSYSVTSAAINLNQWHRIAAHYRNGQILLEVDGVLTTAPASGVLQRQTSLNAITLGNQYLGQMNLFKVIDWTFPDLMVFDNGTPEMQASYDVNGQFSAAVHSTGQMGNRQVATLEQGGFDIALGFFIPSAHALAPGESRPLRVDISNSDSPWYERAYLATTNALVEGYDAAQQTLAEAGQYLDTALGAADFFISFIPFIGDGKDLLIQGIYALLDDPDYDELTVVVAFLGLLADTTAAIGAAGTIATGGTSAIVAGAAVTLSALAKTIKIYSKVMPPALNKALVNFFRKTLVKVKEQGWSYASNALAFSSLLYAVLGDPDLREMLYGMISTEDDLLAWVDYIGEYANSPENVAVNPQTKSWLDYLIKPAYAVRAVENYTIVMRRILEIEGDQLPRQVGELLTRVVKYVENNPNPDIVRMKFEPAFFKATFKAYRSAGEEGIMAVINATKGLRNHSPGYKQFIEEMGDIIDNAPQIFARGASDNTRGARKFLRQELGSVAENKIQGGVHHVHVMSDMVRRNTGSTILHVEHPVEIETVIDGVAKRIGRREYDAVIRVGGIDVHIDSKSWNPERTPSRLRASLKGELVEGERPGQLLKDLVEMYNKRDVANIKIEWHFDKRSVGREQEYLNIIKDELESAAGENLRNILGIVDDVEWENALLAINEKLDDGFIKILAE